MARRRQAKGFKNKYLKREWKVKEFQKVQQESRMEQRPGGYEDSNVLGLTEQTLQRLMPFAGSVSKRIEIMTGLRAKLWRWIDSYETREKATGEGFTQFKRDWKLLRLGIGLQTRLLVEQILWDKDKPWRSLVTGFGAIGD